MLWHKLIGFAALSLLLTQLQFVQSDVDVAGCKNNFAQVAGKCLYIFNNWYTWYMADRHCRSMGAELLSLQNQTQLQEISQWLNLRMPYNMDFWTSGNQLGQKGSYYWQGTGKLANYLPWSTNQPQPNNGDCLALSANNLNNLGYSDHRLTVNNCNYFAPHICEQQLQKYESRICLQPNAYESAQVLA